ncbi:hypothetical protein GOB86_05365 [Acetobacter lambici]|uniref:Flagellar assembly protein FliH/Type III secretion system HrpE domain-containing protein n=1 Tax=Acetobacter lambici TaxID=1332824 RepID=A0ABT1EXV8_9PROT|nr:hypothetical protein [Acetobacter lambici]MCP1241665.1 hypothetical protein [Acetobacter lambici]MCP1257790.1 hypothetical protein [Acetobacter lambici]NHO56501.1 hypothetical protein [Acetobacter lambici]
MVERALFRSGPCRMAADGASSGGVSDAPVRTYPRVMDLEDFGAPEEDPTPPEDPAEEDAPPEPPPPDPNLLSITRDELAAMQAQAHAEGHAAGAAEKDAELQAFYTGCLAELTNAFKAENARRDQALAKASQVFVATVVEIVRSLTALDGTVLQGMQRDLLADAASFARECEGDVTVQCSPTDAQRLQAALQSEGGVQVEPVSDIAQGIIRISTAANTIVIDPVQWRKSMAEKIVASVTALARQRMQQNTGQA